VVLYIITTIYNTISGDIMQVILTKDEMQLYREFESAGAGQCTTLMALIEEFGFGEVLLSADEGVQIQQVRIVKVNQ
jgi:hypothetical protein